MAKISITEIARVVADKHNLPLTAAERFVQTLIEVVNDGLQYEKQVKIKGLGTFKVIDTKNRESVDVNTGERIVIEGRGKITFTPDPVMRDLVNKPFAQFETVVVNDGVDFSEIDNAAQATDSEEAIPPKEEEPKVEEASAGEPFGTPAEIVTGQSAEAVAENSEEKVAESPKEEVVAEPLVEQEVVESPVVSHRKYWFAWAACTLLLMGVAAYLGYRMGQHSLISEKTTLEQERMALMDSVSRKDSVIKMLSQAETDTMAKAVTSVERNRVKRDSVIPVEPKPKAEEPVAARQVAKESHAVPQAKADISSQYEKLNAQVRLGAYRIVGLAQVVTVRKGQTLVSISKAFFGPGMECYVEAYNNGVTEVSEGMKLKIPKLELKKKK